MIVTMSRPMPRNHDRLDDVLPHPINRYSEHAVSRNAKACGSQLTVPLSAGTSVEKDLQLRGRPHCQRYHEHSVGDDDSNSYPPEWPLEPNSNDGWPQASPA